MRSATVRRHPFSRLALSAALAFAICLIATSSASADTFGPQFQVTNWGPPGDLIWQAGFSDIAYNPVTNTHLVVFIATTSADPEDSNNNTDDVYGQFVDQNGNDVGSAFRISTVSQESGNFNPAQVIYNPTTNEFLVAWDQGEEVFVRRVSATGVLLDDPQQVSQAGLPVGGEDIETEAMAWSPDLGRYLVIWKGNEDSVGLVYGQFVNADGTAAGSTDLVLGGSATLHVDDAIGLTYNATNHEFFAVYRAKDDNGEYEIYAQRIDLAGSRVGAQDIRISHMGPDGTTQYTAQPPDVAWNSQADQYLVGWTGSDNTPPLVQGEFEVYAQLVGADGSLLGGRIRVSHMGPDGDTQYNAFRPRVVYNPNANQYFLTWHGDDNTPPLVDGEYQTFGQVLAADGSKIGTDQFRVSQTVPTGTPDYKATRPTADYNSQTCDFMTVWNTGAVDTSKPGVQDYEVFGSRVSAPPCPPPPPAPPAAPAKDNTAPTGSVAGVRRACVAKAKSFRLHIHATDASGVARVRVFVDGKRVVSTKKTSFSLRVFARKLKSGRHRLSIQITDKSGNVRRITRRFSVCAAAKPRRRAAPRFTG